jgi:hypothetical protein
VFHNIQHGTVVGDSGAKVGHITTAVTTKLDGGRRINSGWRWAVDFRVKKKERIKLGIGLVYEF